MPWEDRMVYTFSDELSGQPKGSTILMRENQAKPALAIKATVRERKKERQITYFLCLIRCDKL